MLTPFRLPLTFALLFLSFVTRAENGLWKISSSNSVLYLQGSIHVLSAAEYPLAPAIEQAYAASEVLVLETDLREMSAPETQNKISALARLPEKTTLKERLKPATWRAFSTACTQYGLPPEGFAPYAPWFASIALTMARLQQLNVDPNDGIDHHFHRRAIAEGRETIALETVAYQLDLLSSLDRINPDALIARTLADLKSVEKDLKNLRDAWRTGDLTALAQIMHAGFAEHPELYKPFVVDRNRRWCKALETFLNEPQTHFVVVGAGHLAGEDGLIALLSAHGYHIEPL